MFLKCRSPHETNLSIYSLFFPFHSTLPPPPLLLLLLIHAHTLSSMYPGIQVSLRFRTVCTRLPVHGAKPRMTLVPESVLVRPCATRKPIMVQRSFHAARRSNNARMLRSAESKATTSSANAAAESESSSMTSRAAQLAKEQAGTTAKASTTASTMSAAASASAAPATTKPKKSLWQKVKDEATHYWHGTKLLGLEVRISSKLTWKLLNGGHLTRREARQVRVMTMIWDGGKDLYILMDDVDDDGS